VVANLKRAGSKPLAPPASTVAAATPISATISATVTTAISTTTTTAISTAVAATISTATGAATIPFASLFRGPTLENSLATQAYFALWIDIDNHGCQFIANLGNLLNCCYPEICQLANVNETIDAGNQIQEDAIGFGTHNLACVDLTNLHIFGE
jgi:hypothetical protein